MRPKVLYLLDNPDPDKVRAVVADTLLPALVGAGSGVIPVFPTLILDDGARGPSLKAVL